MSIQMIEARHCTLSRVNVRKAATDPVSDAQLKADIAARGVLQNLIGLPIAKKTGKYEIVAGGRRLAQVQALMAEGVFPKTYSIPVLVHETPSSAAEISLAENLQREAMNPADACIAFRHCVEVDGATVEDVARRFGVTARFVEGRLRLASLAPVVFEALRDGRISLEVAKAYGTTSSHDRQEAVFTENARWNNHNAGAIRRQMVSSAVSASDRLAKLVGREAYVAAGGRIEADLFGAEEELWLDAELLNSLAEARLAEAAATTTGFAQVVPLTTSRPPYELTSSLRPVQPEPLPLSEDAQAKLETLYEQAEALQQAYEAAAEEDEAAAEELAGQIEAVEAEIAALENTGTAAVAPEVKAAATAFLVVDADGNIAVHDTIYFERPAITIPERVTGSTGDKPAGDAPLLSRSLADELAVQRRELLAIHLAHNPGVALDVMLFVLADAAAGRGYGRDDAGVGLSAKMEPRGSLDFKVTGPLADELGRLRDSLDHSWQEAGSLAARFDAFCALDDEQRAAWGGWVVARSLDATLPGESNGIFHNHLGQLLGINAAAWWRPTAANYFGRIKKDAILAVLDDVGGPELKSRYASAKKSELAATAEKIMAGQAIIEPQIKAAALAWVPEAMTFAAAPTSGTAPADEQSGGDEAPVDDDSGDNVGGGDGEAPVDDAQDGPEDDDAPAHDVADIAEAAA